MPQTIIGGVKMLIKVRVFQTWKQILLEMDIMPIQFDEEIGDDPER
jgi:hypothetical protein